MSDSKLENFTAPSVPLDLSARNECVHWSAVALDGTDRKEGRFRGTSAYGALALAQTELASVARSSGAYRLVLVGAALEQLGNWIVSVALN